MQRQCAFNGYSVFIGSKVFKLEITPSQNGRGYVPAFPQMQSWYIAHKCRTKISMLYLLNVMVLSLTIYAYH